MEKAFEPLTIALEILSGRFSSSCIHVAVLEPLLCNQSLGLVLIKAVPIEAMSGVGTSGLEIGAQKPQSSHKATKVLCNDDFIDTGKHG